LPDLLSIDSYVAGDFKYLIQSFVGSDTPYILKGFEVIQPQDSIGTENISISVADSIVYYPSAKAGSFYHGLEDGSSDALPLVPTLRKNATNFVYLSFSTKDSSRDTRAFWDPDSNGGEGAEFSQYINTQTVLTVEVGVSVTSFPEGTVPVCKVIVGTSTISSIQDCRHMMFRLGTGGINPNPFSTYDFRSLPSSSYERGEPSTTMTSAADANAFQGGDKNIHSLKEWMDVVMTRIKELGGTTYWYQGNSGSGSAPSISNVFTDALGSTLKSKGEWIHDESNPGEVNWTEDIVYYSLTDPREVIIRANTVTLSNDEVAYVNFTRDADLNTSATPVTWKATVGLDVVDGPVGAFENLSKGDWVKRRSDSKQYYVRVEEFYADFGATGGTASPALAKSIKLSDQYLGTGGSDLGEYTKGEYLLTDIQVDPRSSADPVAAGGNFFWLAYRSDTIVGLTGITPKQLSLSIDSADGQRARVTSAAHALIDGDRVTITTGIFAGTYKVEVEDADIFYIETPVLGSDAAADAFYAIVETAALNNGYAYQLESASHGLQNDQHVSISGTSTGYDDSYQVSVRSQTLFQIPISSFIPNPGPVSAARVALPRVNVKTEFGTVKVVQGESIDIGDSESDNIKSFIGMDSLAQSTPNYLTPNGYNALNGYQNYNSDPQDSLTTRVSKLTAMMADRIQDRGLRILGRTNISSETLAGNQIIKSTHDLIIKKPAGPDQTIQIANNDIIMPANSVAVVEIDRNGSAPLVPSVESWGSTHLLEENKLILFYRFADQIVYTWDKQILQPFEHVNTGKAEDAQNRNAIVYIPGAVRWISGTGDIILDMLQHPEETEITAEPASGFAQNAWFRIYSAKDVNNYYVWLNKDGGGSDPGAGGVALQVNVLGSDSAIDVAAKIAAVVNAQADFAAMSVGATIKITNADVGPATDAVDGAIPTNFVFDVVCQGVDPDPTIIIPGSVNDNSIDADAINLLGTLQLQPDESAWVRVDRFGAKVFNTVSTNPLVEDSQLAGAIYITSTDDVPVDQDVFVLFSRVGDNLIQHHRHQNPDSNVYEEKIEIVAAAPGAGELLGPVPSGTNIILPFDSRDANSPQTYVVGAGFLEMYLNGQYLTLGEDWLEVGPVDCESNKIQINQELFPGDRLTFRIDTNGGVYFASSGGGGGGSSSLQDAYEAGRTITTNPSQPIVIGGPSGEKLLVIQGDIDVTGVIDPKAITFTPQVSNPLGISDRGLWVNTSDELIFERSGGALVNLVQDLLYRDGSKPMLADLNMNSNQLINLSAPVDPDNAVTKGYGDSTYLFQDGSTPFSGDQSMDGNKLTDLGAPTLAGDATRKSYVDSAISTLQALAASLYLRLDGTVPMAADLDMGTNQIINLGNPISAQDAATKSYVDGLEADLLKLDGTRSMTGSLDLDGNAIVNVLDPVNAQDAATKAYVDAQTALSGEGSFDSYTNAEATTILAGTLVVASKVNPKQILRANASTLSGVDSFIGVAYENIAPAALGLVQLTGEATVIPASGLTVGEEAYVSTTSGQATDNAPSGIGEVVYIIGVATSANRVVLAPRFSLVVENNYEEKMTIVSGAPADDNEFTGPVTAGTNLTLPLDSRNSNAARQYLVGNGDLELYLNGQKLLKDADYTEIGTLGTLSSTIQIDLDLVVDDVLIFRDSSRNINIFASGGPGASALNDLSDVIVSAPANGDLLIFNSISSSFENVASPFGEVDQGANIGTGAGEVFKQKIGDTLEFRKISAGQDIAVSIVGDNVQISSISGASAYFLENITNLQGQSTIYSAAPYGIHQDRLDVYRNGILLMNSATGGLPVDRYLEKSRNSIQLDMAGFAETNEVFTLVNNDSVVYKITITGQIGSVLNIPAYIMGDDSLKVFRNGQLMNTAGYGDPQDQYSETSSTSITLAQSAVAGEIFTIISGDAPSFREDRTSIIGTVISSLPTYNVGSGEMLVYRNGILIFNSLTLGTIEQRYSETSSTSITLQDAAESAEVFTFISK